MGWGGTAILFLSRDLKEGIVLFRDRSLFIVRKGY